MVPMLMYTKEMVGGGVERCREGLAEEKGGASGEKVRRISYRVPVGDQIQWGAWGKE